MQYPIVPALVETLLEVGLLDPMSAQTGVRVSEEILVILGNLAEVPAARVSHLQTWALAMWTAMKSLSQALHLYTWSLRPTACSTVKYIVLIPLSRADVTGLLADPRHDADQNLCPCIRRLWTMQDSASSWSTWCTTLTSAS